MAKATPLDPKALEGIHAIQWRAKAASDAGNQEEAARLAFDAWAAVPDPKYGWDRSYMFLFSLFRFGRLSQRRREIISIVSDYLKSEYYLPDEDGPHFWLGALLFEEGDLEAAFGSIQRAVQISRGRCFREEDPKYKRFFDERSIAEKKRSPSN